MRRLLTWFLLAGISLVDSTAWAAEASPAGVMIYVSPAGKDSWRGRLAESNAAASDGPLATLERARDEIRKMKKAGALPAGGVTVALRAGTYLLPQTFKLDETDSGTAAASVVYRAYNQEKVVLSGGGAIGGWITHRDKILKADVAPQGFRGIYFRQLLLDGKRQPLARHPNFDAANPYGGGWTYADGKFVPMYQNIPGENRRSFQMKAEDVHAWSRPEEGEIFVFARYNWWNNICRVASIDRATRQVSLANDASYPVRPGDRYYVQNLLEELDAPGEWYLDKRTWTLYFWPPAPLEGRTVYAPRLRNLVQIGPRAAFITLRNLTMECCEGNAVELKDTSDCLVAACSIRSVGDYHGSGVVVQGGRRNGVVGNDIFEVGRDAVSLSGGDRPTLTPAENFAQNNYIHHTGVYYKQGVGVHLNGVGNRASNNLIHDCPRFGIGFGGNNLVIEYNHIRHINLETADTGAIYTGGRDWISSRGTCVRYNYFHDSLGYGVEKGKWVSPHYSWGIYLDDNTGGVDVIGNIVVRAFRGPLHLHNGRDNLIENNIFIDGALQQVEYNGWSVTDRSWKDHLPTMVRGYESVAGQPAWRTMRNFDITPAQTPLPNGQTMTGNVLKRNIVCARSPEALAFRFRNAALEKNESDYNLVYHFGGKPVRVAVNPNPAKHPGGLEDWEAWRAMGHDQHSLVADPKFVDPAKDDYRLKPDSPAFQLGFKPIPVEKIGPYADPLRASWPIVEAEGAREKPLSSARSEKP